MIIPRSPQTNQRNHDTNVQNIILNTRKSNTKVKRSYIKQKNQKRKRFNCQSQ